jgi:putative DNA primase/helicase
MASDMLLEERGAAYLDRARATTKPWANGGTHPIHHNNAEGQLPKYRRLSEVEAKPIHWLWLGKFARGKVSIIAGHPGLGKSQITASMAAIVTTGGQWPVDRALCENGSVIILSAEDDAADTISPRLEAAGADLSRCYIVDAVPEISANGEQITRAFNLRTDLSNLSALITKIGDVALVCIDPITAYLGNVDSHKTAEIRALLAPVAEFAARHDVAVIGVSHFNKNGSNEALMRVTGSLGFVAAARAAWVVVKDKENPARRLFLPAKNNLGKDETGYAFSIESCALPGGIETSRVSWEAEAVTITADEAMAQPEESGEDSAEEEAMEWLKEALKDGSGIDGKEIKKLASDSGIAERTLYRAASLVGVKRLSGGFGRPRIWHLCSMSAKECHVCQAKNVGTHEEFGTHGHAVTNLADYVEL